MHQYCVQLYLKKAIKGEIVINLKGKRICGTKSTFQSERKCLTGALESHGASNCIIPPIKASISLQSWSQAYEPSSTLTVESSTAYRYIYDINYVCEVNTSRPILCTIIYIYYLICKQFIQGNMTVLFLMNQQSRKSYRKAWTMSPPCMTLPFLLTRSASTISITCANSVYCTRHY